MCNKTGLTKGEAFRGATTREKSNKKAASNDASNDASNSGSYNDGKGEYTTVAMTMFLFRGQPDTHSNRHALIYFTSPDPDLADFFETVHIQRGEAGEPWMLGQISTKVNWQLAPTYLSHFHAGLVVVPRGQEMVPVDIVAGVPLAGREFNTDWNGHNFLLEGLQGLVRQGLMEQEWYYAVQNDFIDHVLHGSLEG